MNPHLAHDTKGTIEEARRLWKALDRPNLLIKVPATKEGLPAIRELIGEGINVNITLLFGLSRYREVAEAYIGGIETLLTHGKAINHVASVASFFLSRIDVLLDPIIEKRFAKSADGFNNPIFVFYYFMIHYIHIHGLLLIVLLAIKGIESNPFFHISEDGVCTISSELLQVRRTSHKLSSHSINPLIRQHRFSLLRQYRWEERCVYHLLACLKP